ncbi:MAG: archease [Candidatus Zixiibacteriota bacterium]|nr:MAG: archease [candidate division Zixibacteria bacterium]
MGFRIIENIVSGDFAFEAFGETLEDLFASCAEACFSAMAELSKVDPKIDYSVDISADNLDDLLVDFLSELIYLKDAEKIFFSRFDINIDADNISLNAVARGERIDYNKHDVKVDVKAATYHNLEIKQIENGFEVNVILDL